MLQTIRNCQKRRGSRGVEDIIEDFLEDIEDKRKIEMEGGTGGWRDG